MNRTTRTIRSTLGKAIGLCAFALTLVGGASAAFDHQESSGAEHRKPHRKGSSDVGIMGHGFVRDNNNVFITIDAPGAGAYTVVTGISDSGKTVGGYVDDRGILHGFLKDKQAFTVIDFPGAKATFVSRINAQGQIVGAYSDDPNAPALELSHGFLLDKGTFTKIDFPGAVRTQPNGINNLGQIVGQYLDATGRYHGFLLDSGVFTTIDAPGGTSTFANDIDDSGRIVGVSSALSGQTAGAPLTRGFQRDAQGVFTPIVVPDASQTAPRGINNAGQIAGYYIDAQGLAHGFLLDNDAVTTIDATNPLRVTVIFDLNDRGQLAGGFDLISHGYQRDKRGNFTTIDHPASVAETTPEGINNRGQIVGRFVDATGTTHGFLRDKDGFTTIDVPGALATNPTKLNDRGQIVGISFDAGGIRHGFLWRTACSPPSMPRAPRRLWPPTSTAPDKSSADIWTPPGLATASCATPAARSRPSMSRTRRSRRSRPSTIEV
jgi:probable HAF family extracellular repeat protein